MKIRILVAALFCFAVVGSFAQGSVVAHPLRVTELGTVTVMERTHDRQGRFHDKTLAHAVGFAAGDCDVLTTYAVVEEYEVRQRWNVEQRIEVSMRGKVREGRLRPVGVYPMGFNLACIDLDPQTPDGKNWTTPPLALGGTALTEFVINDDFFDAISGTPFLDKKGKVAFMLATDNDNSSEFIPAANIRLFLNEAKSVPRVWPSLVVRLPK